MFKNIEHIGFNNVFQPHRGGTANSQLNNGDNRWPNIFVTWNMTN
jgi:hypothetical protein